MAHYSPLITKENLICIGVSLLGEDLWTQLNQQAEEEEGEEEENALFKCISRAYVDYIDLLHGLSKTFDAICGIKVPSVKYMYKIGITQACLIEKVICYSEKAVL